MEEGNRPPSSTSPPPKGLADPRTKLQNLTHTNFFIKDIARSGVKNLAVKSSASST